MHNFTDDNLFIQNIIGILNGVAGACKGKLEELESTSQHSGFVPIEKAKEISGQAITTDARKQIIGLAIRSGFCHQDSLNRGFVNIKKEASLADRIRKGRKN